MVWRNVVKSALWALLPTAIVPGLIVGLIIQHFGVTLDAVLIIVMLAQFYIIWAQVEVSLVQTKLSELAYEPIFFIEVDRVQSSPEGTIMYCVKLKNVGDYPAYNVFISTPNIIGYSKVEGTIGPKSERVIFSLDEAEIRKYENFEVSIDYTDTLGRWKGLAFNFSSKFPSYPLTVRGYTKMPGILLNAIEDLRLTCGLFTMERRVKKLKALEFKAH